jgi:adenosylhomocysteine nucleosidase
VNNIKDIILIALEQEAPAMATWENVFFTGVGKVNASMTAAKLVERYKPQRVWNFGTAGGINLHEPGIHKVGVVVQRDMKCTQMGIPLGETPFEPNSRAILIGEGISCSTGDDFVTDPKLEIPTDIVEMEAYAIAKVCKNEAVDFHCYKYISDTADEDAGSTWAENVANGEEHFIKIYKDYHGG